MPNKSVICVIIVLLFHSLIAETQDLANSRTQSYLTYIYRINNEQAREFYLNTYSFTTGFLNELYDFYPTDSVYRKELPVGHFLFVKTLAGNLNVELQSVNDLSIRVLNNHRDLIIAVYDSSGGVIRNADVLIDNKKVKYHHETETYRLAKSNDEGLVSVRIHEHESFFKLNREQNNGWLKRAGRNIYVTFPFNHIISIPVYIKNSFENVIGHGQLRPPGIWFRTKKVFQPRKRIGYIAFNKPEYKPSDTVRFKAVLTNQKGKRYTREVECFLKKDGWGGQVKRLSRIAPFRKGAYQYQFILHDSLKLELDNNYLVELRRSDFALISETFRYEQYELKNNTYEVRNEDRDDGPCLYLKGADSNGMPLYDTRVEVLLRPRVINHYYANKLFIPDTLWYYETKLENSGETKISIPDTLFPAVSMSYIAEINFLNSNNERITRTQQLNFDFNEFPLQVEFENDSLVVRRRVRRNAPSDAVLEVWNANKLISSNTITLPYREKINLLASKVNVKVDGRSQEKIIGDAESLVNINAVRTADSIFIQSFNPRKIPFRYFLFKNQKFIESGHGQQLSIRRNAGVNEMYFLSLEYVWAGNSVSRDFNIPFNKKNLNVELKHPDVVHPGQRTRISISVKNAYGKPVEGTDITAYAITSKFTDRNSAAVPSYFHPNTYRKVINNFNIDNRGVALLNRYLDYKYWEKRMGLDSLEYYHFLFPDSGWYENRRPATITQFAPFVVTYGAVLKSHIIYVDGMPVYLSNVSTLEPYSFAIAPGMHKIEIRTNKELITIPRVRIDSLEKLVFSIDRQNLPKGSYVTPKAYNLDAAEIARLRRYFVLIPRGALPADHFLQQDNRFYLRTDQYVNSELVGPFYPGRISYYRGEDKQFAFQFEPFHRYEFGENVVRMKSLNMERELKLGLWDWYQQPNFRDTVLTRESLNVFRRDKELRKPFKKFPDYTTYNGPKGKLTIDLRERLKDIPVRATVLFNLDVADEYMIYPGKITNEDLASGHYRAVVLFTNGMYGETDSIFVAAFGTNYYDLANQVVHERDSLSTEILEMIRRWVTQSVYSTRDRELELQKMKSLLKVSRIPSPFGFEVNGRITGSDGEGIPGVNIMIKGTAVGTVTDANGFYQLNCPADGTLIASFVGYTSIEQPIDHSGVIDLMLQEDVAMLEEIVIVGYGEQRRYNIVGSTSVIPLQGFVAGVPGATDSVRIMIRGISSVSANDEPLVILDGIAVRMADINPDQVTAIEILKGASAQLYGSRGANGVVLISTKQNATRQYLRQMSNAFIPQIIPQESQGRAIRRNFRDYAFWKPALITDKNGQAEFEATFPDDITGWKVTAMGVASKGRTGMTVSTIQSYKPLMAQISGPLFLVENDSAVALGRMTNYSQKKISVHSRFKLNEVTISESDFEMESSRIDSLRITVGGSDSVKMEYSVGYDQYKDGELQTIPVFRRGMLESVGHFVSMPHDTSFSISFSPHLGKVKVQASADMMDVMLDEIQYLNNYSYECNEQLASKLRALVLEKEIKGGMREPFRGENEISKILRKLMSNQNSDGGWGWWRNGSSEVWISLHVARAMLLAERSNSRTPFDSDEFVDYLQRRLGSLTHSDKLNVWRYLADQKVQLKIEPELDSIKHSKKSTLYEKMQAEYLRQALGKPVDWSLIDGARSTTIKGNYYWADETDRLHDNAIQATLIVFQIATKAKRPEHELERIRNFFLEQRHSHWRNTYESSIILESLIPTFPKGRYDNPTLRVPGATDEINKFPFEFEIETTRLDFVKTGSAPVYLSVHQEKWNANPERREDNFVISTTLGHGQGSMQAGKPVLMKVRLEVKADAEFVMLEIPIPAGCTYSNKDQNRANGEVHREHYNNKTNIYCRSLKKGVYTYTIELLPRYSGFFTLNPAVVECMYSPVLYGRNEIRQVRIN